MKKQIWYALASLALLINCVPPSDMCKARMREKDACRDAFLLEFGSCKDSACQENAMAMLMGCHAIPTDSCGPGGKDGKRR